jgi:hypothetical protein
LDQPVQKQQQNKAVSEYSHDYDKSPAPGHGKALSNPGKQADAHQLQRSNPELADKAISYGLIT